MEKYTKPEVLAVEFVTENIAEGGGYKTSETPDDV